MNIEQMAREAGYDVDGDGITMPYMHAGDPADERAFLERFAALVRAQAQAEERERCVPEVDELAQHIRWLNGSNKMGACTLAEKLVDWLRSRA